MFKYVSFIFILLTPYLALSQTNESEAKAAFLLAEEFYAKSDFKNALGFIEKAKKSLGEGNCKIYYLEILMRNEMYRLDKTQYESLLGALNSFQSSKDIDAFNREKVFEVLKIKMLVEQERDNKRIADSLAVAEKIRNEKKFDEYISRGWPLNVSFENLKKIKANHPFFLKKLEQHEVKGVGRTYYYNEKTLNWTGKKDNPYFYINNVTKDSVAAIAVGEDGLVKRYVRHKLRKSGYERDAFTHEQADIYMKNLIDAYTKGLGFEPKIFTINETPTPGTVSITTYVWQKNDKRVTIQSIIYYLKNVVDIEVQQVNSVE